MGRLVIRFTFRQLQINDFYGTWITKGRTKKNNKKKLGSAHWLNDSWISLIENSLTDTKDFQLKSQC